MKMNDAEYHATTAINKGRLWDLYTKGPRYYEARYVTRTIEIDEDSDALRIGRVFHSCLLEGKLIASIPTPPADALTSNGQRRGKAWESWLSENPDYVTDKEAATLAPMLDVAQLRIGHLLELPDRQVEVPVFWRDEESGLECKCKPDCLIPTSNVIWCLDIKTTRDPTEREFQKDVSNYGYWMQHVHYAAGLWDKYRLPVKFVFVACGKEPPYQCRTYDIEQSVIEAAGEKWRTCLDSLAWRMNTKDWSESGENDIVTLIPWIGEPQL